MPQRDVGSPGCKSTMQGANPCPPCNYIERRVNDVIQIKRFDIDSEEEIQRANEFLAWLPDEDVVSISYGIVGCGHCHTVLIAYKTE